MAAPPPLPLLIDELIEEVLFRIPPDDPKSLIRSALICKQWRRLLSDPRFRRRFREFHRTPPILGVLCNSSVRHKARFIPTSSFGSPHVIMDGGKHVVDARHGRVLLHSDPRGAGDDSPFTVWDPITGETLQLPNHVGHDSGTAAVLCAATARGCDLDHLHCQHGHFLVVFIGTFSGQMFVYTYSSEDVEWRLQSSSRRPDDVFDALVPSLLLGNALHFVFGSSTMIVKYDLVTRETSVIPTAPASFYGSRVMLMATEGGELGLARAEERKVYIWSRQKQANTSKDAVVWALIRVIQIQTVVPARLLGLATKGSDNGILFVRTGNGAIASVNMKSGKATIISNNYGFMSSPT